MFVTIDASLVVFGHCSDNDGLEETTSASFPELQVVVGSGIVMNDSNALGRYDVTTGQFVVIFSAEAETSDAAAGRNESGGASRGIFPKDK